jgi:hypothetical protein
MKYDGVRFLCDIDLDDKTKGIVADAASRMASTTLHTSPKRSGPVAELGGGQQGPWPPLTLQKNKFNTFFNL